MRVSWHVAFGSFTAQFEYAEYYSAYPLFFGDKTGLAVFSGTAVLLSCCCVTCALSIIEQRGLALQTFITTWVEKDSSLTVSLAR